MKRTLPLAAAQPYLDKLIDSMVADDELILTQQGQPVAIVIRPPRTTWPSEPGTACDRSFWMSLDFDAPLEDFAEYME